MSRSSVAASALVLLVYALGLYAMPRHVFWSPDEGGKLLQTKTIRFNGGIHYVLPYPGKRLDPELRFYATGHGKAPGSFVYPLRDSDGHFHFHWPMWFPLLSAPPLALFGITGGYLIPLLAGWLTALVSGLLAAEIDPRLRAPAILVVGLSSPVYFYSLCFWEHTLATALGLLGVFMLVRGRGRLVSLLASLPIVAVAASLRIEMVALIVAIVAACFACGFRSRGAGEQSVGFLKPAWMRVLLAVLTIVVVVSFLLTLPDRHAERFGLLWHRFIRLDAMRRGLVEILINSAADFGAWLSSRWLVLAGVGAGGCIVAPFIRRGRLESALTLIGLGALLAVSVNLVTMSQPYRSLHGLLPVAPFMILAVYAVPLAWQRPGSPLFVLTAVGLFYLAAGTAAVFANSVDSSGVLTPALQWGQRYLLTLYPILLILGLAAVLEYWRSPRPRLQKVLVVLLCGLLIGCGFMLQRRGIDESLRTRRWLAEWQQAIEQVGPVVTDLWWLPAALADLYARQEIFVVRNRGEIREWSRVAAAAGVQEFTFASLQPIVPRRFRAPGIVFERHSPRVIQHLYLARFRIVSLPHPPPDLRSRRR